MTTLEPTSPEEAVQMYNDDRKDELSDHTKRKYSYQFNAFTNWCDSENLTNMNTLTGRKVQDFKLWRAEQVKPVTLENNMWTIRSFVEFCEHINIVPEGVHRKIRIPKIDPHEKVKDNAYPKEEADAVLDHLEKFEYASLRHALFMTLWKTGMRMGALRALDMEDFNPDRCSLSLRHRPKTGTPLKNKYRSERTISISQELSTVIEHYLEQNHPGGTDKHGRNPLFMGRDTRAQKTTVQRNIYTATRPCHYSNECPHSRNLDTCEALSYNTASKCPSSCGPQALKKGYITAALNAGQPMDVTGERTNTSQRVLKEHYDQRSEEEQMDSRKQHLKDV